MLRPALALMLASISVTAGATVAEDNARDMRCLILATHLSTSDKAEQKTAGQMASQYYLGRIDGRSPDVNLETLLREQANNIKPDERQSILTACGQEIMARSKQVQEIGQRVAASQAKK